MDEIKSKVELDLSDLISQLDQIKGSFEDLVSIQEKLGDTSQTNHDAQVRNLDVEYEIQKAQLEDIRSRKERNAQAAKDRANNDQMRRNGPSSSYEEAHGYDYLTDHKGRQKMLTGVLGHGIGGIAEGAIETGLMAKQSIGAMFNLPGGPNFGGVGGWGKTADFVGASLNTVEDRRAATYKAGREFDANGTGLNSGGADFKNMQEDIRTLSDNLNAGPMGLAGQFAEINKTFAAVGVTGKRASAEMSMGVDGVSRSVIRTSFDIDLMYKQASGTAAKQSTQLMADFGVAAEDTGARLMQLGDKAKQIGSSYGEFTTSVLNNAAALREQRASAEDVAEIQVRMSDMFKQQNPHADQAWVNAAAGRATGEMTGALANLDVGMASVVGRRMGKDLGLTGKDPLEAYFKMKDAASNGKGHDDNFASRGIAEMGRVFTSQGMNDYQARFAMQQQYHLSPEGSKAMLDMAKAEQGGHHDEAQKIYQEHAKDMVSSEEKASLEANQNSRAEQKIQQDMVDIGHATFGIMVDLFSVVFNLAKVLFATFTVGNGKIGSEGESGLKDAFNKLGKDVVKIGNAEKDIAKTVGDRVGTTITENAPHASDGRNGTSGKDLKAMLGLAADSLKGAYDSLMGARDAAGPQTPAKGTGKGK